MIKKNDRSLEDESIENVTKKMATRFHIVNVFKKLGLIDEIQRGLSYQSGQATEMSAQVSSVRNYQAFLFGKITNIEDDEVA